MLSSFYYEAVGYYYKNLSNIYLTGRRESSRSFKSRITNFFYQKKGIMSAY